MEDREFDGLLSRLVDNDLDHASFQALEQYLLSSEQARERYMAFMELQTLAGLEVTAPVLAKRVIPINRVIRIQRIKQIKSAVIAAAALMALLAISLSVFFIQPQKQFASFVATPGSEFEFSYDSAHGESLRPNTLAEGVRTRLKQGFLEIELKNEVRTVIQAPAEFVLRSESFVELSEGVAWFHVPSKAKGFQVRTPEFLVTDLGTEFGIFSDRDQADSVHVFKGEVRVDSAYYAADKLFLKAGEASVVNQLGKLEATPIRRELFSETIPETLPYVHWSFDEVVDNLFPATGTIPSEDSDFSARIPNQEKALSDITLENGRFSKAFKIDTQYGHVLRTGFPGIGGDRPRTVAFWVKAETPSIGPYGLVVWGRQKVAGVLQDPRTEVNRWKIDLIRGQSSSHVSDLYRPGAIQLIGTGYLSGRTQLCDGLWHHVACCYKPNSDGEPDVKIYLNGKEEEFLTQKEQFLPNTILSHEDPNAIPVSIGQRIEGYIEGSDLKATIDELYIFEGALEQNSILRLMHLNSP